MNPYSLIHFVTGIIPATLAVLLWQRKHIVGRVYITLTMVAITVWVWGYGLELASTTLAEMRFWVRIEYLGIATCPPFWLLFTMTYTRHTAWMTRRTVAALFVIPIASIVLNATNELHMLFYRSLAITTRDTLVPLLVVQPGPWYYVHICYSFIAMCFGLGLIAWMRHQTPRSYRGQLSIILISVATPLAINALYLLHIRPFGQIDLTPLALAMTGGLVYWGLHYYRMFDISPVARYTLFEYLHDIVIVLDRQNRVVDRNRAAQQQLSLELPTGMGQPLAQALANYPQLVQCCEDNVDTAEVQITRQQHVATYALRRSPLTDQHKQYIGAMIVLQDITARKTLELEREALIAQLHQQAHTDELTGIANRRAFIAAAERELQRRDRTGQPLAMLLLDIDHFKQINDTYGHAAGDLVLQAVTQCCSQQIRAIDLLGRYGGEEFAIMLVNSAVDDARDIGERVRAHVASLEVPAETTVLRVTISIGIAVVEQAMSLSVAFRCADAALYAAKKAGRNQIVVADDLPAPLPLE